MRPRANIPKFIRPPYPPRIVYQEPYCSICIDNLVSNGEGWECHSCGYSWPFNAEDDAAGAYKHQESERTHQAVDPTDIYDIPSVRHPDRRRTFILAHNTP